jgi:hypothetical protein
MYDENWFDAIEDEMKAYFGLCIVMTVVKKATLKMNWSKRSIVQTSAFRKTIPRVQFILISWFLHFTDNPTADANDEVREVRNVI